MSALQRLFHRNGSVVARRAFSRVWSLGALLLLTGLLGAPRVGQAGVAPAPAARGPNVVLVTLDGFRIQEVFGGMDPAVLPHATVENRAALERRFLRPTPQEARLALLPFVWGQLVAQGVMLGNPRGGVPVRLTNPHRVSYPGYAELLTGQVQAAILDNQPRRIPRTTGLEFARTELRVPQQGVAAYASWEVLAAGVEHVPGTISVNCGYAEPDSTVATPDMKTVARVQASLRSPWDGVRPDAVTMELALEHLRAHKPRFLYVALGETDDWAHDGRYDRMLEAAQSADAFLMRLWNTLQSMPEYRDNTTLLVTADHGRGAVGAGWKDHGPAAALSGSDRTFLLAVGPGIPALGEPPPRAEGAPSEVTTTQLMPTLLAALGLDPRAYNPQAGAPLTWSAWTGVPRVPTKP